MVRRQSGIQRRASAEACGALVVGAEARSIRLPSGTGLELPRQRALRLILLAMVRERLAHPGRALSAERLLEQGWPGERVTPISGGIRVRVAICRLRSLGLRDVISSRDYGYLLRADAAVIHEDTSMAPKAMSGRPRAGVGNDGDA